MKASGRETRLWPWVAHREVSMERKSSLLKREEFVDCSWEEADDRDIRMMRCLLLSIMADMARSQYLRQVGGGVRSE